MPIGPRSGLLDPSAAYLLGGSVTLQGQYVFPALPLLYVNLDGGYQYAATPGTAPPLNIVRAGLGTGVNIRVGNTMSLQAGIDAGWYLGIFGDAIGSNT